MTPEQRVEEYCSEYARHGFWDSDYTDLLDKYIDRDGLKAVPGMIKIIDEFDPTRREGRSKEKDARCYAAWGLLGGVDDSVVRLRALGEGRKGIEAMRRLVDRMRAAHLDTATGDDYAKQLRYRSTLETLQEMEGINMRDEAIRDTLKLRYKISLSNQEMLDFVNYMISQDPSYPAWIETELYKDLEQRNEAGNPLQYVIVKNIEPFRRLYLQYKAKAKSQL
jgi:hypothetical protein